MYWRDDGARDESYVTSVRAARANLGMALIAADDSDGARGQLEAALDSPGDVPPAWQLRTELGHLAQRQGKPVVALERFLQALVESPPECAGEPADHALRQLDGEHGSWLAQRADESLYLSLLQRGERVHDNTVSKVAARLATLRGDLRTAGKIATEHRTVSDDDAAWQTAIQASTVLTMLEGWRFDEALAALDDVRGEDESVLAYLRALALYGLHRDVEAIGVCAAFREKPDLGVAQSICYLALAATASGSDRARLLEQARESAAAAARLESGPEPSLARAQVLLEGDLDLSEGRRLLGRTVGKLGLDVGVQDPLVWRLQRLRRKDEFFAYFDVELAHALSRHEDVIARAGTMTFALTSDRQDGAARQRLAAALVKRGDLEAATAAYGMAADSFSSAGDIELERSCLRRQLGLEFAVPTVLRLAERSWQSAMAEPVKDAETAQHRVDAGLEVLRQLEGHLTEDHPVVVADDDVALANLLQGLLVGRGHQLTATPDTMDPWRASVSLLLASELAPTESYYACYLSERLTDCNLHHAAYHFARRAHTLFPDDAWLQSQLISSRGNWHGVLDEATKDLLENFRASDPAWHAAITAWDQVMSGRGAEISAELPDADTNGLWVQQVRAYGIALRDGREAGRRQLGDLVGQSISMGEYGVAAKACLRTDLTLVGGLVERALRHDVITPRRADVLLDFERLVSSDGRDGLDRLQQWVHDVARPQRLLEMLHVDLPTLAQAYPDLGGLAKSLGVLAGLLEDRLSGPTAPLLTAELSAGEAWCADNRLVATVRALLAAVDAGRHGGDPRTPLGSARALLTQPLQALAVDRLLARQA